MDPMADRVADPLLLTLMLGVVVMLRRKRRANKRNKRRRARAAEFGKHREAVGTSSKNLITNTNVVMTEAVKEKLVEALKATVVEIEDVSGPGCEGAKLAVLIVSDAFEGKSRIACHRLVFDCLKQEMEESIHSLQLKTYTPKKYKEFQESGK